MSKRNIQVAPARIERDAYLPPIYLPGAAEQLRTGPRRPMDSERRFDVSRLM